MGSLHTITSRNFHRFCDRILEIERASFPSPWSLRSFESEVHNPVSHLWGLVDDGRCVGYICFWMYSGEIHLLNIAVEPSMRGRGLGSDLLYSMIRVGISKRIHTMWLEVRPSNLHALRVYGKAGFVEVARRERYYGDTGEDAIVMAIGLHEHEDEVPAGEPSACSMRVE